MLIDLLERIAVVRPTVRIGVSLLLSLALLAYARSPLPGNYLGPFLVLVIVYLNLALIRIAEAADRAREVKRTVEIERARWTKALEAERSERISSFARRDSSGELPNRCLMIVAVPRSGSTWLMDALRAHPAVYLEPSAIVFQQLGLEGNRYPKGLSNGADATADLEVSVGRGATVPEFSLPATAFGAPNHDMDTYAVEKIHPEFFDFDVDAFLALVDQLHQRTGMRIKFVYQIRDPRAAVTSFLTYKRRDPTWYSYLPEDGVPSFMERTYAAVRMLAQCRGGLVIDYADLVSEPLQTLASVYRYLWPDIGHSLLQQMAGAALEVTSREARVAARKTPFLGQSPDPARDSTEGLASFFELHAKEIAECYESCQALVSKRDSSTG